MKRTMACTLGAAAAAGLAFAFLSADSSYAENRTPDSNREYGIQAEKCWITLVDEATLSADRPGIVAFVPQEGDYVHAEEANFVRMQHIREVMQEDEPDKVTEHGDYFFHTRADTAGSAAAAAPGESTKLVPEKKGVVAGLRADAAEAAIEIARVKTTDDASIKYQVKDRELAQTKLERARDTNKRVPGTVPELELKAIQLEIERATYGIEREEKKLEMARYELKQAQAELDAYKVFTEFDGVVQEVYKKPGEAVRQGDPIVMVKNLKRVYVEGYIPYSARTTVQIGSPVSVIPLPEGQIRSADDESYPGKIVFISETAERVGSLIRVKAEVPNVRKKDPDTGEEYWALSGGIRAEMTIRTGGVGE